MDKYHRRSIRLPYYDYTQQGAYFVTICTYQGERLFGQMFGQIVDGKMVPSEYGNIVQVEWEKSVVIRKEIELDVFVVMPNHFHGIVWILSDKGIVDSVGAHGMRPTHSHAPLPRKRRPRSLGSLIGGFKAATTKRINDLRGIPYDVPVWQRNYYEHIICNEQSLEQIRDYIVYNPLRWHLDRENPDHIGINEAEKLIFSDVSQ